MRPAIATILVLASVLASSNGRAQFAEQTIAPTNDAQVLVDVILGFGLTLVTGSAQLTAKSHGVWSLTSSARDFGSATIGTLPTATFVNGPLGLSRGILLTTGEAEASGPVNHTRPSDALEAPSPSEGMGGWFDAEPTPDSAQNLCGTLAGVEVFDTVVLRFGVTVPDGARGLQISYVFGSEEFPDFRVPGRTWIDAFGFFVKPSGLPDSEFTNFALYDGQPINVNGDFFEDETVVRTYATAAQPVAAWGSEHNGLTPILRSATLLEPGTYEVLLTLCDGGDDIFDSIVYLHSISACYGSNCSGTSPLPPNMGPIPQDDTAETTRGEPIEIDVLANDTDPDGDEPFIAAVDLDGFELGAVLVTGNRLLFIPTNLGTETFSYVISDGLDSSTAIVRVTVANRPPQAGDDVFHDLVVGPQHQLDVLSNDSEPDLDERLLRGPNDEGEGELFFTDKGEAYIDAGRILYRAYRGATGTRARPESSPAMCRSARRDPRTPARLRASTSKCSPVSPMKTAILWTPASTASATLRP